MNKNRSVATIEAPEFINLSADAINPGISKCEIKLFYLGKNRNGSYIDKNTAIQMANSLPGCPIVGAYIENKEDFGDHGEVIRIEDGEIHFSCKTVPYGFVGLDSDVWFQKFMDTDEFGNEIEREYMMTTGYLWTEQYEEAKSVIEDGKGQSMELDGETMEGHWATDNNSGIEFFIINDAIFTKLCILGDDVEPCFEGASIKSPEVNKAFSRDESFGRTLYTMMNELKDALQNKGGSEMPKQETQVAEDALFENNGVEKATEGDGAAKDEEFANKKEESKSEKEDDSDDEAANDDAEQEDYGCKKKKSAEKNSLEEDYAKLENEFNELKDNFALLENEVEELRAFKLNKVNEEKDALINKYHMLSEEDKADIVANKENYSLDEIESKLALIYVQKNVDFESVDGVKENEANEADPITTFSLDDNTDAGIADPFIEALREANELL